ncbi:hypothetical protein DY000_02041146 [Brassica cretica]|uniref:Uncharacterized protein n=1 Tax=Brassica cretica TaxID=69181 RepID=A0ABQ7BJV3_BRACR|nr:hypothetical protein DY000_02041146 [Brassica cretica]
MALSGLKNIRIARVKAAPMNCQLALKNSIGNPSEPGDSRRAKTISGERRQNTSLNVLDVVKYAFAKNYIKAIGKMRAMNDA